MAKQDKYDLLVEALDSLRNKRQKVLIETVGVRPMDCGAWEITNTEQIPTKIGKRKQMEPWWNCSQNSVHATSIKIGDVNVRKINDKYVVRSQKNGEAVFDEQDTDFNYILMYALYRYDNSKETLNAVSQDIESMQEVLLNPKLLRLVQKGAFYTKNKSKAQRAADKLISLGVPVDVAHFEKRFQDMQSARLASQERTR